MTTALLTDNTTVSVPALKFPRQNVFLIHVDVAKYQAVCSQEIISIEDIEVDERIDAKLRRLSELVDEVL